MATARPAERSTTLLDDVVKEVSIKKGPDVPEGVMARHIDDKHILYLDMAGTPKAIVVKGKARSMLFDRKYDKNFTLEPFEPEFIELH